MMNSLFSWVQCDGSFTQHKMLKFLGLMAVLLVPLPSLTEGKKVMGFCFVINEVVNVSGIKVGWVTICFHVTHLQTKT